MALVLAVQFVAKIELQREEPRPASAGRRALNQKTVANMTTLTITLDEDLDADLREAAASRGLRKAEFVQDALRRQLALVRLGVLQGQLAPYARACGWETDEDVFREVS